MDRCSSLLLSMRPAARGSAAGLPLLKAKPLYVRNHCGLFAQSARPCPLRCRAQTLLRPVAFEPASSIPTAAGASSFVPAKPRFNSTSTSTPSSKLSSAPASLSASPSSSSSSRSADSQGLTWNHYLALRRTRRRTGLVFSIVTTVLSTGTGLTVLSSRDLDAAIAAAIGLDPLIVLGLSTMSFAVLGWLVGPFMGNAMFGVWYRGIRGEIAKKDRAFFHRISQRRVDPSSSSLQNPVPDYYGEKIGSVTDYRRWLKDQRAFHLKRGGGAGNIAEAGRMVRSAKVAGA